jgi:hypothetical protein
MASRRGSIHFWRSASVARAAMVVCVLVLGTSALAQEAQSPSQDAGATAAEPPAAAEPNTSFKPGFIHEFGRWLDEGASKFKSGMQGAQETLDKLGGRARDAAKDATGAVMALPNTKAVTARERCAPAQNGAPDCQTAATTLCRGKGFQTGKILDTQTEQKCPAKLLLSGRAPNDSDCPTEIFVTRAMCQ